MLHLSFQDILAILGPMVALLGFMWHHFNGQFKEIKGDMKEMEISLTNKVDETNKEMKAIEVRLTNKIDSFHKSLNKQVSIDRERISRIEGQLTPTQIQFQSEETPKKKLKTQRQPASA